MKDLRQQLAELLQGRVCLMGLGNVDCGDDGFGVRLAEELLQAGVPDVVAARTTPEDYVGRIADQGFDCLVFLDAVEFGASPGSVALLNAREVCARYPQISTHKISLGVLAKWVLAKGKTEVWLLGVQPQSIRHGETLTPAVSATSDLLRMLLLEVNRVGTAAPSTGSGQALGCSAERNSAAARAPQGRATPGRTAEGGCPYVEAITA
jgi:hydrogenase maturation protease